VPIPLAASYKLLYADSLLRRLMIWHWWLVYISWT